MLNYLRGITDARERMVETIYQNGYTEPGHPGIRPRLECRGWEIQQHEKTADALLADGWVRQRMVGPGDVDFLNTGAVLLSPGGKVFRKWTDWFADGQDGWVGMEIQHSLEDVMTTEELLRRDYLFPAKVLDEGHDDGL